MIFVVLCKHLNCVVDKTVDTGHITDCNTNYRMYGVSFWCNGSGVSLCKYTHIERFVPMTLE